MLALELCGVSIHAPAKGATEDDLDDPEIVTFQSTRPRRARRYRYYFIS